MSDPESNWASVEKKIAGLLKELPRPEDEIGIAHDRAPLSDASSKVFGFLWAALVVGAAAGIISIASPYFAWIAALLSP